MRRGDPVAFVYKKQTVHGQVLTWSGNPDSPATVLEPKRRDFHTYRIYADHLYGEGQVASNGVVPLSHSDARTVLEKVEILLGRRRTAAKITAQVAQKEDARFSVYHPTRHGHLNDWDEPMEMVDRYRPDGWGGYHWSVSLTRYLDHSFQHWRAYRHQLTCMEQFAPRQFLAYAAREIANIKVPAIAEWLHMAENTVSNHVNTARAEVDVALGWNVSVPGYTWELERERMIAAIREMVVEILKERGAPIHEIRRVRQERAGVLPH